MKVKIEFIKDHFTGIKEGVQRELTKAHAQRLIDEGYAREVKPRKPRKKKEESE